MNEFKGYSHDRLMLMYRESPEHLLDFYVTDDFGNAIISNLNHWDYSQDCEH